MRGLWKGSERKVNGKWEGHWVQEWGSFGGSLLGEIGVEQGEATRGNKTKQGRKFKRNNERTENIPVQRSDTREEQIHLQMRYQRIRNHLIFDRITDMYLFIYLFYVIFIYLLIYYYYSVSMITNRVHKNISGICICHSS